MHLPQITDQLDRFFRIETLPPDMPFSKLVPQVYAGTPIDLSAHLEPAFLQRFHGLMIDNGPAVDGIYTLVFLSDEILDKVLANGEHNLLLFSHHPLFMETSNRGFLPLDEHLFAAMRERAISVYILHTPLDVHEEISTSRALARELGLQIEGTFCQVAGGQAGVYGQLPSPRPFGELLSTLTTATGVSDLHFVQHHQAVRKVALVAGGVDPDDILEAAALDCDVLVTGTYYNQVQNEIGQRYRDKFEAMREQLTISLVEGSHYATEAVVMRQDVLTLCQNLFGLSGSFVPQDDPWH